MLVFFRNSQGPIMWVVAAIVIVAFTFFYDAGKVQNRQDVQDMFEIGGKSYTKKDWDSTLRPLPLIFRMGSDYIDFYQQITSERASTTDSRSLSQAFVYNLTLLREKAKDYEIHISDDDIVKEIKKMDLFQVRDTLGQPLDSFDVRQWELFKSQFLSAEFTEQNFRQFISDKISYDKIRELIGSGSTPSDFEVDQAYKKENQHIVAYVINKKVDDIKESIEVSDEEVKERFDKINNLTDNGEPEETPPAESTDGDEDQALLKKQKTLIQTKEKRSFEYIFFPDPTYVTPEPTPEPTPEENENSCQAEEEKSETETSDTKEEPLAVEEIPLTVEEDNKEDSIVDDDNSVEDPAKVEAKDEPKVLTAAERSTLLQTYTNTIQGFNKEIKADGADFSTIAARYVSASSNQEKPAKYQKIDPPIDRDNFPEDLKDNFQLSRVVFQQETSDSVANFRTIEGFWFVKLVTIAEPSPMNFEEAKDILKEKMVTEKALDKIKSDLDEAKKSLSSSTADGPTLKEAAEKQGYNVTRYSYNLKTPPSNEEVDSELLRRAVLGTISVDPDEETKHGTIAGKISETLMDEDGGILVYVAEKSLKPNPLEIEAKREISQRLRAQNIDLRFRSWLIEQRKDISDESRNLYLSFNQ